MAFFETVATFASQNLLLFLFTAALGTALWSEAVLISFIVFAMTFKLPLTLLFMVCYIGSLIGDIAWFVIGRKMGEHFEKKKKWEAGFKKIAYYFDKLFGKNVLLTLSAVKMLYGTRFITIFYIAKERINFWKFMIADILATILWLVVFGGHYFNSNCDGCDK